MIFKLTPIYAQLTEFLFHFEKLQCLPARQLGVQGIIFIIATQKSFMIQSVSVKSGNYLRGKIIHCTTRKRSCWKVMISVVSVFLSVHGKDSHVTITRHYPSVTGHRDPAPNPPPPSPFPSLHYRIHPLVSNRTLLLPMFLSSGSVALNCVGVGFNLTMLRNFV